MFGGAVEVIVITLMVISITKLHHKALAICYDPSPVMVAISPRIFMENCTAKFRLAPVYSKSMEMGHQNVIKCVGSTSF